MSLGDLVISLSMNTATLQSDAGKANQLLERMASKIISTSKQGEIAIQQMTNAVGKFVDQTGKIADGPGLDRLRNAFSNLNIKSAIDIDREKTKFLASFEQIKNSGVATADEIKRAYKAMNDQIAMLEGGTSKATMAFDAFSIKSMLGLAKIQVAYQLVNKALSALIELPSSAIDAIENYNAAVIKTSALIVSYNSGKGNIAEQYKEAREYALGLQDAMVDISKHTIASAEQLGLMNTEFQKNRIFLDPTNGEAVKGFEAIANAVATITAGQQNQNMQFSQEIRGLMSGEMKPGNMLLGLLKGIDPNIKDHIEDWKKQGNVIENIGKLLVGFQAASGDINSLWVTIKTTFSTLYQQVIRDGLLGAFNSMVSTSQQFGNFITKHKEELSQGVRQAWLAIKGTVESIGILFQGWKPLLGELVNAVGIILKDLGWLAAVGLPSILEKFFNVVHVANALLNIGYAFGAILVDSVGQMAMSFGRIVKAMFQALTGDFKGASDSLGNIISDSFRGRINGYIDVVKGAMTAIGEDGKDLFSMSGFEKRQQEWDKLAGKHKAIKPPKVPPAPGEDTEEDNSKWDTFAGSFNSLLNQTNIDGYKKKLDELADKVADVKNNFLSLSDAEKAASNKQDAAFGGTLKAIDAIAFKVKEAIKEEERVGSNNFLGSINKIIDKSEVTEWQRKQSEINSQLETTLVNYSKLTSFQKEFLKAKGVDETWINNAFAAYQDRVKKDFDDKEAKRKALELKAIRESEIQDQLTLIDHQQKMNQLTSPEAVNGRIILEKQLLQIQKDHLAAIDRLKDPTGWLTQQREIVRTQREIEKLNKELYDRSGLGGLADALYKIADSTSNLGVQVSSFVTSLFKGMEDALVNFVTKGTFSFKQFADSVIQQIARIAVEQAIIAPLTRAFGMLMPGMPSTGSFGAFTSLGSGLNFNSTPSYSLGTPQLSIPSFDIGTDFVPKDMLALVHHGEKITPAAYNKNNDGNNVLVNVNNNSSAQVNAKPSTRFDGRQMIIDVILEDFNNGGPLRRTMSAA